MTATTHTAPATDAASTPPAPRWTVEITGDIAFLRSPACVAIEPADWRDVLAGVLANHPDVASVGCKRLDANGRIFSMGDFIVHPKSFHHHAYGMQSHDLRFAEEADLMIGGAIAVRRAAFERAGGEATLHAGRLGAMELGLRLRRDSGRCLVVPQAAATDAVEVNSTPVDDADFRRRWGFDWRAADLEELRAAHSGTGLLWNARFHAPGMPFIKYEQRGALVWESYQKFEPFQKRTHHIAAMVKQFCPPERGLLVDVGSGDGFFSHTFAKLGLSVLGVDPEPRGVEVATRMTSAQEYPGQRPRFILGRGDSLPVETGAAAGVTLMDVIEHLPNPVRLLREISRILAPGGHFIVITPEWRNGVSADATYHLTEYTLHELLNQLNAIPGFRVADSGRIGGIYHDAIGIAQRV